MFALLVLACFAAFFVTQRLKHTPTAVQDFELTPFFSPTPAGHVKQERISFKLAQADAVTVTIINSEGDHGRDARCGTIRWRATNRSRCAGTGGGHGARLHALEGA